MRLFLAITLPDHWTEALHRSAQLLRTHSLSGTFTLRENFHLTLAFLGELPHSGPVENVMASVSASPFTLRTAGTGRFRRREGDVWWVGLEPCPGLNALHRALTIQLRAAGLPTEGRPFQPHLTLGRRVSLKDGFDTKALEASLPPLSLEADSFALMLSERVDGRLTYTPLCRQSLLAPGG